MDRRGNRIPMWLKVVYTAFVAVMVPYYWHAYGPLNFLYFCDIAVLVTLPAIWLENRFLFSMQAVAILIPQMLWVVDFTAHLITGAGVVGMTDYMFEPKIPLFVRALSSFHGWMPFLLLYLVWKLGYDRRAWVAQCVAGILVILGCRLFSPPPAQDRPAGQAVNINYVFGISDSEAQTWMPGWAWVTLMVVTFPLAIYWPTHWVLGRLFGAKRGAESRPAAAGALAA